MKRHRRQLTDNGETLIEGVIALLMLTIAILAVISMLGTAANVSAVHRDDVRADAVLSNLAEAVKAGGYHPRANLPQDIDTATFQSVPGFPATVTSVHCWLGEGTDTSNPLDFGSCEVDKGIQLITLRVTWGSKDQDVLQVIKSNP